MCAGSVHCIRMNVPFPWVQLFILFVFSQHRIREMILVLSQPRDRECRKKNRPKPKQTENVRGAHHNDNKYRKKTQKNKKKTRNDRHRCVLICVCWVFYSYFIFVLFFGASRTRTHTNANLRVSSVQLINSDPTPNKLSGFWERSFISYGILDMHKINIIFAGPVYVCICVIAVIFADMQFIATHYACAHLYLGAKKNPHASLSLSLPRSLLALYFWL